MQKIRSSPTQYLSMPIGVVHLCFFKSNKTMSNDINKWSHPYTPDAKYSKRVVYLSMEYGIDQAFKIYSGGLGYLAGSHMRSAYQLKQNLIGIGMLWKFGYYDQVRDENGNMRVLLRKKFYSFLEDTGIRVPVYIKGYQVWVKALYLAPEIFNTVPMYFLTTDFEDNDDLSRSIMTRLYHPNDATRVAQNIVLGVGGAMVTEALGGTDIYHMNEAHALPVAFHLYKKHRNLQDVKDRLVFTTHTPERAGNSVRKFQLLEEMGFFADIPIKIIRELTGMHGQDFEYTPAALRMAKVANGVSQKHGEVARDMWQNYEATCSIGAITNAQDEVYWTDPELLAALKSENDAAFVRRKKEMKRALFKIVADQGGDLFDENILTIVWARRFAGYKRADLIMRDLHRFKKLVTRTERPIQIIWAGKPYPEDYSGISQFNHIQEFAHKTRNIAVLTGYELSLSAALKRGADIWLNTPRIPQEASGTSGMTAAMNGAINCSTLDGWIPEFARDGENAFVLPAVHPDYDTFQQDEFDYANLMRVLEEDILPTFYERPDLWLQIMKNSMKDVVPAFDSKRMANAYYEELYTYE
jgi:starch phosphorylase